MIDHHIVAHRRAPDDDLTPERLDRLVFEQGFPLYRPDSTTFAYRGDAHGVQLVHFGIGLPDDLHFDRQGESNWWLLALDLPHGTRLEYQLEVSGNDGVHMFEDPLNPFVSRNPYGANSVCRSDGYHVPPWAQYDAQVPTGSRRSFSLPSEALQRHVSTTLYLPDGFDMQPQRPYPLVVFHDGSDYLRFADAAVVLDNLIGRGLIPEVVAAFCDPGDRLSEYGDDEGHARFLADELVPYLDAHLPLEGTPRSRCLAGASFGAVATLSTAVRRPHTFGRLMLQSGSFAGATHGLLGRDDPPWGPVKRFVSGYVEHPAHVAERISLSCGVYEPLIVEHRTMRNVLRSTGMTVMAEELLDGHTWGCWRDDLGSALPWLFADHEPTRQVRPYHPHEIPARFHGESPLTTDHYDLDDDTT